MNSGERGGVKYQPFDALRGFKEAILNADYEHGKRKMPELSEDQAELINKKLIESLNRKSEIEITYYKDGYFYKHKGILKRVDERLVFENNFIILKNRSIEIT